MKRFLFGVHCHQPFGNLDHVVLQAIDRCYRPFVKGLKGHPGVKAVVHISGCLFDFFEEHSPDMIDLLRELADRKQIELLGGGYYEPVLPVWPERDQRAQLKKAKDHIKKRFHQDTVGMWLAERVWEPQLPFVIRESGYSATFLDDSHFLAAGLTQDQIHGYFTTEDRGREIAVFPINKSLRYMIPFKPVPFLEEFFRSRGERLLTMVDDGEKFGVWPGTAKWVYHDGWLEAFFSFLEKRDHVETVSLQEALALGEEGNIYLPTTSYEEMEEWTLPAARQIDLRNVRLAANDERARGLIRGGFFRNFFAKYAESRWLYQRLLGVGENIKASSPLYDEYLKAQCNCAFWHGIFGGLYLPHLRHAIWKQLVSVDRKIGKKSSEASLRNKRLQVFFSEEGTVREIDDFRGSSNLVNTLRRRIEGYHLLAAEKKASSGHAASIHEEVRPVPEEFAPLLIDDEYPRDVLRDHLFMNFDKAQTMAKAVVTGAKVPFRKSIRKVDKHFQATFEGEDFLLSKDLILEKDRLVIRYCWKNAPPELCHVISSDFFILDGHYKVEGSEGERPLDEPWKGTSSFVSMRDTVEKIDCTIIFSEPVFACVLPVRTVSMSESGYNCIRQALAVIVQAPARRDLEIQIVVGG